MVILVTSEGMDVELARPLFSERLRLSRCAACGPNMGMRATAILTGNLRGQIRVFIFREPCRACGGHSRAFVEDAADA